MCDSVCQGPAALSGGSEDEVTKAGVEGGEGRVKDSDEASGSCPPLLLIVPGWGCPCPRVSHLGDIRRTRTPMTGSGGGTVLVCS